MTSRTDDGVLPTFLLIGAAKAGTGAVYEYCRQHPEIFMSAVKEPHYFSFAEKSIRFAGPGDEGLNRNAITRLDHYRSLFRDGANARARGEASVSYLYSADAARNIAKTVPGVRLVAILRNPVDRAYSAFMYRRAAGLEPFDDFEEALRQEPVRIDANWQHLWHYRNMGLYGEQLGRYLELFPASEIRIHLYEDLIRDRDQVMSDIFNFVGVDPAFRPEQYGRPNISGEPRSRWMQWLFLRPSRLRARIGDLLPTKLRRRMSYAVRKRALEKAPLSPAVRRRCVEMFEDDVRRLEKMIGRDLGHWLRDE